MFTKEEKAYLEKTFVSKSYLNQRFEEFEVRFEARMENKMEQKFLTRNEFLEKFDLLMGELKAIREEIAAMFYRQREHSDQLENHEGRIIKLEALNPSS